MQGNEIVYLTVVAPNQWINKLFHELEHIYRHHNGKKTLDLPSVFKSEMYVIHGIMVNG